MSSAKDLESIHFPQDQHQMPLGNKDRIRMFSKDEKEKAIEAERLVEKFKTERIKNQWIHEKVIQSIHNNIELWD